jgi:hypothetical protein
MKILGFILSLLISGTAVAQSNIIVLQTDTLKLIELDLAIFNNINEYRKIRGVQPVKYFDTNQLRKISYVLTDLNTRRPSQEFDHTRDPEKIFNGYNGECIYMYELKSSTNSLTDSVLTQADINTLAKIVVQAWIDSPNHNWIISGGLIKSIAVTSTITIVNGKIRVVVSYHHIDNAP